MSEVFDADEFRFHLVRPQQNCTKRFLERCVILKRNKYALPEWYNVAYLARTDCSSSTQERCTGHYELPVYWCEEDALVYKKG